MTAAPETGETAIDPVLMAEHDAWFAGQRAAYLAKRPAPAGAWDGGNWYRMIQEHTRSMYRELRPAIDAWWRERGYRVVWRERDATLELLEPTAAGA